MACTCSIRSLGVRGARCSSCSLLWRLCRLSSRLAFGHDCSIVGGFGWELCEITRSIRWRCGSRRLKLTLVEMSADSRSGVTRRTCSESKTTEKSPSLYKKANALIRTIWSSLTISTWRRVGEFQVKLFPSRKALPSFHQWLRFF